MGRARGGAEAIAPRLPVPVSANDTFVESISATAPKDAMSVLYTVNAMAPAIRCLLDSPKATLGLAAGDRKPIVKYWLKRVLNDEPWSVEV